MGEEQLAAALKGCELVIIPAGVPRKPGMTRDDLFKINAGIVKGLVTAVGKHCPGAWINMISNPVNSTVPIAAETLKAMGVYDPKRLFGVTTLDVVRAHTFFADKKGLDVGKVDVPVVGGHAGITILPLLSKASPATTLTDEEVDALTKRTQDGGTEVVAAKAGKGSATLSMAYAGSLMADACLRAMNGEKDVHQYTYVQSSVQPGISFFASKVLLGKNGVEKIYPRTCAALWVSHGCLLALSDALSIHVASYSARWPHAVRGASLVMDISPLLIGSNARAISILLSADGGGERHAAGAQVEHRECVARVQDSPHCQLALWVLTCATLFVRSPQRASSSSRARKQPRRQRSSACNELHSSIRCFITHAGEVP